MSNRMSYSELKAMSNAFAFLAWAFGFALFVLIFAKYSTDGPNIPAWQLWTVFLVVAVTGFFAFLFDQQPRRPG